MTIDDFLARNNYFCTKNNKKINLNENSNAKINSTLLNILNSSIDHDFARNETLSNEKFQKRDFDDLQFKNINNQRQRNYS